jgi:hypothetical protein
MCRSEEEQEPGKAIPWFFLFSLTRWAGSLADMVKKGGVVQV